MSLGRWFTYLDLHQVSLQEFFFVCLFCFLFLLIFMQCPISFLFWALVCDYMIFKFCFEDVASFSTMVSYYTVHDVSGGVLSVSAKFSWYIPIILSVAW